MYAKRAFRLVTYIDLCALLAFLILLIILRPNGSGRILFLSLLMAGIGFPVQLVLERRKTMSLRSFEYEINIAGVMLLLIPIGLFAIGEVMLVLEIYVPKYFWLFMVLPFQLGSMRARNISSGSGK